MNFTRRWLLFKSWYNQLWKTFQYRSSLRFRQNCELLVSRERTGCIERNITGFLFPFLLPNSVTFTPYQTEETYYIQVSTYKSLRWKVKLKQRKYKTIKIVNINYSIIKFRYCQSKEYFGVFKKTQIGKLTEE